MLGLKLNHVSKRGHRSLPINLRHATRYWGLSSLDESIMNKDKVIFKIIGVRRLKYLLQITLRWMWLDLVHDLEEWLSTVKASYFLTQCWPHLYHHIAPLGQTILIKKGHEWQKYFHTEFSFQTLSGSREQEFMYDAMNHFGVVSYGLLKKPSKSSSDDDVEPSDDYPGYSGYWHDTYSSDHSPAVIPEATTLSYSSGSEDDDNSGSNYPELCDEVYYSPRSDYWRDSNDVYSPGVNYGSSYVGSSARGRTIAPRPEKPLGNDDDVSIGNIYTSHTSSLTTNTSSYSIDIFTEQCKYNNLQSTTFKSLNRNVLRVIDPLWGEFAGHRWIPLTKASDAELWCFLWSLSEQTVG